VLPADPRRTHIDILHDLSLSTLYADFNFHNFVKLHQAWEKRLDTSQLNEHFYRDIANWYFWALKHPGLVPPRDIETDDQRSIFVIRLITRLIFRWFLQEKGLIPPELFRRHVVAQWLKDFSDQSGTYYKGVLQNLFFATLNQKIEDRGFRRYHQSGGRNGNRGVTNRYRYRDLFRDPDAFVERLKRVPFVNGGLFDCLDRVYRNAENQTNIRLDDFSEEKDNRLCIPNEIFFGMERAVDLSEVYQDKRKKNEKVHPIIEILSRYKFTVEENTPLEQEIALDPELLGKVFENLFASYNEDTRTTARKATGSFYTPREVVSYMVDEALIAYFLGQLGDRKGQDELETKLRQVFDAAPSNFLNPLSPKETDALIAATDGLKILDPACGSGAFPMGALHRLVDLLAKLDPDNYCWKQKQLERAQRIRLLAEQMREEESRENALHDVEDWIKDIEYSFDSRYYTPDFARKLYLLDNCIFGVDIQSIACQIAKLRFFISLIVDQKVDRRAENFGVLPLPNLETKIVAADTLISIERFHQHQFDLFDGQIRTLREGLELVRHQCFNARTPERKQKCREKDAQIRKQIAEALTKGGLPGATAALLAAWDPYDQNKHASFFDPAWMFSIEDGFDVIIGNPPYVRQEQIKDLKPRLKEHYECFTGTADLYVYFYERGIQLLKPGGAFSFISSNKWFRSAYGGKLRGWLATHTRLKRIIDFGDAPVFKAISYPCIVILTKGAPCWGTTPCWGAAPAQGHRAKQDTNAIRVLNWQPGPPVEEFVKIFRDQSFALPQASLKPDGWRLESSVKLKLLDRIRAAGTPLGEYVRGRFYRGVLTGLNEAFVIDRTTRDRLIAEHPSSAEVIKPFLRGRDVKRWRVEPQDLWLIFTQRGIDIKKYPAILEHLRQFKSQLEKRAGDQAWYELQASPGDTARFEQPKIVVPAITNTVNYAPDSGGYYSNDKTSIVIPPSVSYALAVLNSEVSWWFARQTFASKQGGFYEFKPMYFSHVPIPAAKEPQQKIVECVTAYLLWLNQTGNSSSGKTVNPLMLSYFEQLLNGLVHELFFPDELHAHKLFLFDYAEKARLPALDGLPKAKRTAALQEVFERIYDLKHPIRGCLFSLRSLPTVRLIEGDHEEATSILPPVIHTDQDHSRQPLRETA
jgi:Type I restriction-modification system methyltransferase subunit